MSTVRSQQPLYVHNEGKQSVQVICVLFAAAQLSDLTAASHTVGGQSLLCKVCSRIIEELHHYSGQTLDSLVIS